MFYMGAMEARRSVPQRGASLEDVNSAIGGIEIAQVEDLSRRDGRAPDYAVENQVLVALVTQAAESPDHMCEALAELALAACHASAAGVAVLDEREGELRGRAVVGDAEARLTGESLDHFARVAMDRAAATLFVPTDQASSIGGVVREALVVPCASTRGSSGVVWVTARDAGSALTAEHARLLTSLAKVAAATFCSSAARDSALAELDDARALHDLSTRLIQEDDLSALRQQVLEAAVMVMRSDAASLQMLHPDRDELELLAWTGFHPQSAAYWSRVSADSRTSCGDALRTLERIIVADVDLAPHIVGTPNHDEYRRSGIRSVVSTPLTSRAGILIGMISTHWSQPHQPSENALHLLNVVARQAGDLIERQRLLESERAARAEAVAANSAKSAFLAAMSHELRTPLNAITGYADILEAELHGPLTGDQRKDLDRIKHSARHLLGLISDILDLARVDAGTIRYDRARVPLDPIIREAHAMVAPQVQAKQLALDYAGTPDPVSVLGDAERIRQILLNLVVNAIKFTASGGRISVHCERQSGCAAIQVRDTGIGIAPDQLTRIFDPFVQVERRFNTPVHGLGLGLSISRDLARAMGGDLTVESQLGSGSTFTLTLPMMPGQDDVSAAGL